LEKPYTNRPDFWISKFPRRKGDLHKYDYGHAVILGAHSMTGATRLAAEACARIGAGLTSVLASGEAAFIYRATLPPHIIVEDLRGDFADHMKDVRRNVFLIGPGAGKEYAALRGIIAAVSALDRKVVLDADGLNAVAETQSLEILNPGYVLTPHEGEFRKLFPDVSGSSLEQAHAAAIQSKCIVVLKGSGTVIAAPDGRVVLNISAPPSLATAGTGDVLAGMITGLVAQGMPGFEAACASVWIHGECARKAGPTLVASDLCGKMPQVIADMAF
jgi:NAD(P)H-hydrate epimerase